MNVLFAGFNGFGQFRNCQKDVAMDFQELNLSPTPSNVSSEVTLGTAWAYNAIAINKTLYIHGALPNDDSHTATREFHFDMAIRKIACNDSTCLTLLINGDVWKLCMQTLNRRKLNFLVTETADIKKPIASSRSNASIESVIDIGCTYTFSVAITNGGAVYSIPSKLCVLPTHVRVVKICCGAEHVLLLTSNGDVYAFGSSTRGQLGLNRLDVEDVPVLIEALAGIKVIDIAAGAWHSAAVSAFGDLYMWGWNVNGQLGRPLHEQVKINFDDGTTDVLQHKLPSVFAQPEIVDIPGPGGNDPEHQYQIAAVNCGAQHTIVTTKCGRLFGCGWNKYGQLGMPQCGVVVVKFEPLKIDGASNVSSVTCGGWYTLLHTK